MSRRDYGFDDFMDDLAAAGGWLRSAAIWAALIVGVILLSRCS